MFSQFFWFMGRAGRSQMWLTLPLQAAAWNVVERFMGLLPESISYRLFVPVTAIFFFAMLAFSLSVHVRRLHDRGRGWFWILLFLGVPGTLGCIASVLDDRSAQMLALALASAIALWWFVEGFLLRGTNGPNRYGPDPVQHGIVDPRAVEQVGETTG